MTPLAAQAVDPQVGRMMESALQDAESFRQQVRSAEYEATMHVQEWDGRGRLRGTAKAVAIMRPGDPHPMTFISREVHGKVRLPDEKDRSKEDEKDNSSLFDFAREHRIADRFEFRLDGTGQIAGERARRIDFAPKPHQPEKSTADRFLDSIAGAAWISEERDRLVKFEMRLLHPFQLFWIFAVLKECSIEYELLEPGEILGHAKLKVIYALTTPVYSIRQQHDVDLNHFRKRTNLVAEDSKMTAADNR
ncbi:MAG: hypothetical protein ACR2MF_02950 [Chthoniobacterales bacterium]